MRDSTVFWVCLIHHTEGSLFHTFYVLCYISQINQLPSHALITWIEWRNTQLFTESLVYFSRRGGFTGGESIAMSHSEL